jgi:hypothetical protein
MMKHRRIPKSFLFHAKSKCEVVYCPRSGESTFLEISLCTSPLSLRLFMARRLKHRFLYTFIQGLKSPIYSLVGEYSFNLALDWKTLKELQYGIFGFKKILTIDSLIVFAGKDIHQTPLEYMQYLLGILWLGCTWS